MDVGVRFSPQQLPVLRSGDVAVIGGSVAGVAAALHLARAGRDVVLVESRTYLGSDMTATLRPWLPASSSRGPFWAEVVRRLEIPDRDEEIPLPMGALKVVLEDMLLEAGSQLLYASMAVGVVPEGVVIGNKSGRQVIEAAHLVDATDTALLARLAGMRFTPLAGGRYYRTLEFDGVREVVARQVDVPEYLGIVGPQVETHIGYRGSQHVLVEYALDLPFDDGPDGYMEREIAGRHIGMALAAHLINDEPAFREAVLGSASLELFGPHAPRRADEPIEGLWSLDSFYADPYQAARAGVDLAARIGADFVGADLVSARDLVRFNACASVEIVPRDIGGLPEIGGGPQRADTRSAPTERAGDGKPPLRVAEPLTLNSWRTYWTVSVPSIPIPTFAGCDILVAGGGTSGATATNTAASEGLETVLLDMNSGLGGTGTLGGVHSYWYGRHVGFSARVQRSPPG